MLGRINSMIFSNESLRDLRYLPEITRGEGKTSDPSEDAVS